MHWASPEKLIRLLSDDHGPTTLDEFVRVAPEMTEIKECVGSTLASEFIVQHVDQFHGSTKAAFQSWLGTFSSEDLTGWLIDRIKTGDGEALNYWLAKNRPKWVTWTRHYLGVPTGRGVDASDIVQDTTLDFAQHIKSFRGQTEAELLSWVRVTLRRDVIDSSRRQRTGVLAPPYSGGASSSGADPWTRIAADCSTPSQSAARWEEEERIDDLRREKEEQILEARECLLDQQLDVFLQREVYQVPLKTIAVDLGLTTVETARLFYEARCRLQGKAPLVDEDDGTPAARLKQVLRPLPDRQRQAIELKHVEKYSLKEIGEVMDCKALAVGAMIYRGMKELKGHVVD